MDQALRLGRLSHGELVGLCRAQGFHGELPGMCLEQRLFLCPVPNFVPYTRLGMKGDLVQLLMEQRGYQPVCPLVLLPTYYFVMLYDCILAPPECSLPSFSLYYVRKPNELDTS
jgi:hypothetical protein